MDTNLLCRLLDEDCPVTHGVSTCYSDLFGREDVGFVLVAGTVSPLYPLASFSATF